jgi:hypothetical protein
MSRVPVCDIALEYTLAHGGCGLGTCWGEELALKMFQEAGFQDVAVRTLDHDIMNNYYVCRKR